MLKTKGMCHNTSLLFIFYVFIYCVCVSECVNLNTCQGANMDVRREILSRFSSVKWVLELNSGFSLGSTLLSLLSHLASLSLMDFSCNLNILSSAYLKQQYFRAASISKLGWSGLDGILYLVDKRRHSALFICGFFSHYTLSLETDTDVDCISISVYAYCRKLEKVCLKNLPSLSHEIKAVMIVNGVSLSDTYHALTFMWQETSLSTVTIFPIVLPGPLSMSFHTKLPFYCVSNVQHYSLKQN